MEETKKKTLVEENSAPFVLTVADLPRSGSLGKALRLGDLCPKCHTGRLDYDGLLNLACPVCGYAIGGCFT